MNRLIVRHIVHFSRFLGRLRRGAKPIFTAFTVVLFSFNNVAFVHAAESNLWSERRAANRLEARLPASLPANPLSAVDLFAPAHRESRTDLKIPASPVVPGWLAAQIAPFGAIRNIHLSKDPDAPLIIHVQDIHEVEEAQRNTASIIETLSANAGITLVGLEGAAGAFNLDPYRVWPDKRALESIAAHFLKLGYLGGAEFAAITMSRPPVLWGMEALDLYTANIKATQEAAPTQIAMDAWLQSLEARTEPLKAKIYSENLKTLDRLFRGFREQKESLGTYVTALFTFSTPESKAAHPNLQLLLKALAAEQRLDFKRVESERVQLVESLTRKISRADVDRLVRASVDYRSGRLGYREFHESLKESCRANGVPLSTYVQFNAYVEYVLVADRIDRVSLLRELDQLEESVFASLATTPQQQALVGAVRYVSVLRKLVSHQLTPEDWAVYAAHEIDIARVTDSLNQLDPTARPLPAAPVSLRPYEDFCRLALRRNEALVGNLLSKMRQDKARAAFLIAGGFHTDGLAQLLDRKGASYVVVTPRITQVPKENHSLDVFVRDPIPLERVFAGEKIFLKSWVLTASNAATVPGAAHRVETLQKGWAVENVFANSLNGALAQAPPAMEFVREGFFEVSGRPVEGEDGLLTQDFNVDGRRIHVTAVPPGVPAARLGTSRFLTGDLVDQLTLTLGDRSTRELFVTAEPPTGIADRPRAPPIANEIALIGIGSQGKRHLKTLALDLRGFLTDRNLKVRAVDRTVGDDVRTQYDGIDGVSVGQAEASAVFADPKVRAVVIATPGNTHYTLVKQALLAGKHVLVEKPFTKTTEQARELVALAAERNLLLMVGHNRFYLPHFQRLRNLIASGRLGNIKSVEVNYLNPFKHFDSTHTALEGLGYHLFYMINGLLGRDRPTSVSAAFRSDDFETVGLRVDYDGIPVTVKMSRNHDGIKNRSIIVRGDKHTATFNFTPEPNPTILEFESMGVGEQAEQELTEMRAQESPLEGEAAEPSLNHELRTFINSLLTEGTPPSNGTDAINVVEVLEQIRALLTDSNFFYHNPVFAPLIPIVREMGSRIKEAVSDEGGVVSVDGSAGVGKSTLTGLLTEFYELMYPGKRAIILPTDQLRQFWPICLALKKKVLGNPLTDEDRANLARFGWDRITSGTVFVGEEGLWRNEIVMAELEQLERFFDYAAESQTVVHRESAYLKDGQKRNAKGEFPIRPVDHPVRRGDVVILEGKFSNREEFAGLFALRVRVQSLATEIRKRFVNNRSAVLPPAELTEHMRYYDLVLAPSWASYATRTENLVDVFIDLCHRTINGQPIEAPTEVEAKLSSLSDRVSNPFLKGLLAFVVDPIWESVLLVPIAVMRLLKLTSGLLHLRGLERIFGAVESGLTRAFESIHPRLTRALAAQTTPAVAAWRWNFNFQVNTTVVMILSGATVLVLSAIFGTASPLEIVRSLTVAILVGQALSHSTLNIVDEATRRRSRVAAEEAARLGQALARVYPALPIDFDAIGLPREQAARLVDIHRSVQAARNSPEDARTLMDRLQPGSDSYADAVAYVALMEGVRVGVNPGSDRLPFVNVTGFADLKPDRQMYLRGVLAGLAQRLGQEGGATRIVLVDRDGGALNVLRGIPALSSLFRSGNIVTIRIGEQARMRDGQIDVLATLTYDDLAAQNLHQMKIQPISRTRDDLFLEGLNVILEVYFEPLVERINRELRAIMAAAISA